MPALVLSALAAGGSAQPTFRASVDLVTVPVVVTSIDPTRRVSTLSPVDFQVFEDGVRQDVSVVSREPRPLSVCILLDWSPSMASGRQPLAIRTIDTLLDALGPDDEASLVHFAARPRVILPWTPAPAIPPISWIDWRVSLGTALLDAVKEGLRLADAAHNPLPVLLVVSDGGDNASGTRLAALVETRRQSETIVYAVDTELPPSRMAPPVNRAFADSLPDLVGDSGGTIYNVRTPEAGEAAARALLDELRSQYTIGYVPKRPLDGRYRRVKVDLLDRHLAIRHRGGYLAAPH